LEQEPHYPPRTEMDSIRKALQALKKEEWLEFDFQVNEIMNIIIEKMSMTYKGRTMFLPKQKFRKDFPKDFLVYILAAHLNRRGMHGLIARFLEDQKFETSDSSGVGEDAVRKRLNRLLRNNSARFYTLWGEFNFALRNLGFILQRYLNAPDLSPQDKASIRRDIMKPFEYFLPDNVKKSFNIF
jgi:hypothetical protein